MSFINVVLILFAHMLPLICCRVMKKYDNEIYWYVVYSICILATLDYFIIMQLVK